MRRGEENRRAITSVLGGRAQGDRDTPWGCELHEPRDEPVCDRDGEFSNWKKRRTEETQGQPQKNRRLPVRLNPVPQGLGRKHTLLYKKLRKKS